MRLIDANALQKEYMYEHDGKRLMLIDTAPTIEERKTGKWNFVGNQMFECTSCGVAYTEYQFEKMRVRYNDPKFPRFCPNCGAKMEAEA